MNMVEQLKKLKTEGYTFLLAGITFYLWLNTQIPWWYGLIIYLVLFAVLLIQEKRLESLLVVTLFSIIVKNNPDSPDTVYTLTVVLTGLVFIRMAFRKQIKVGSLLVVLVLNLSYVILSLTYTPVFLSGKFGVGSILQGYMAYLIITNSGFKPSKEHLLKVSKVASIFSFTIACQLFFVYYQNGIEKTIYNKNLIDLGWQFSNLIAPFFILFLPIAYYKYTLRKSFYPLYFIMDILSMVGLVLTLSRGAYVGFFVTLVLIVLFIVRDWKKMIRYIPVGIGTVILGYFIPIANKTVTLLYERFSNNEFFDDNNRYPLWDLATQSFLEKPLFGYGVRSSSYLITTIDRGNYYFHNFILQVAATLGILGLIFLAIILFKTMRVMLRPHDKFVLLVAAALIGSLAHQFVDVMFDYFIFGLVFYALIGLVEIYRDEDPLDAFTLKQIEMS
ncbi:O-antigen ligase family protein [Haloplasma contractile]|uniref:O-antigen ligase protein n=1 Tax=Haloplasma contractile SSD-17B TaxID=1033810 RepID=U2FDV0_9MOLU|nr:O-antigen ligase family protein [Haloplasma contractile]ERJ11160.1 O-antigen ligase protein [Haloplasma contractile SSD-17B]